MGRGIQTQPCSQFLVPLQFPLMSSLFNLLGPRKAFDGGLFLPDHKSVTSRRAVELLRVDGPLHVPLTVRQDLKTEPNVRVGDRVLKGERLSNSTSHESIATHAPTSGKIVELSRAWTTQDGYLPCAVLEPDGREEALPQHQGWEDESLIVQLAEHGVMCSEPRAPLHSVIKEAVAAGVTDLIVNAMETEPYLTADLRMLVEEHGRIIDVTCELADALGVSRAILALPFRHRRVVKRMEAEAHGRYVEIAAMANPYPQCQPLVLVKALLDCEIAPGGRVLDKGVIVLPLAAVVQAAEALLDDRPITHTVMTVAGDAVERAGTYRVAIGTPMRHLAERVGLVGRVAKAVCGGPLTGLAMGHEEAVVTATTKALLLFSETEPSIPVPCIHCGWCVEDCPVGIDPPSLMQLESKPNCTNLEMSHLKACLDCGVCSYVCPAQLPLGETIHRTRTRFEQQREPACLT